MAGTPCRSGRNWWTGTASPGLTRASNVTFAVCVELNRRSMRILRLIREPGDKRTGTFTSGIVSLVGAWAIALFFTRWKHAGENIAEVLKQRAHELPNANPREHRIELVFQIWKRAVAFGIGGAILKTKGPMRFVRRRQTAEAA